MRTRLGGASGAAGASLVRGAWHPFPDPSAARSRSAALVRPRRRRMNGDDTPPSRRAATCYGMSVGVAVGSSVGVAVGTGVGVVVGVGVGVGGGVASQDTAASN